MSDVVHTLPIVPLGLRATRMTVGDGELVVFSFPADQGVLETLFGRLTPAEQAIALSILDGLSNREIAELRGTSQRTVAKQVEAVFRKLDVGSRGELAARLADVGTTIKR